MHLIPTYLSWWSRFQRLIIYIPPPHERPELKVWDDFSHIHRPFRFELRLSQVKIQNLLCNWWCQVTELGKFTWILSRRVKWGDMQNVGLPLAQNDICGPFIYLQCTVLKILALKVYLAICYPSSMLLIFDIWNFTLPKNWPPAWKELPPLKSTVAGWNSTFSACFQTNLKRKPDQNKHIPSGICLIQ